MQSLKVEGVHLCCPKCVKAVNAALTDVPGVTTNNAAKNAKSFTVTGNFNDADVFAALEKKSGSRARPGSNWPASHLLGRLNAQHFKTLLEHRAVRSHKARREGAKPPRL